MNAKQTTVLRVEGMTCSSCVSHVEEALREVEGVGRIQVRLREGRVTVEHDRRAPSLEAMMTALREAGYESAPEAPAQATSTVPAPPSSVHESLP